MRYGEAINAVIGYGALKMQTCTTDEEKKKVLQEVKYRLQGIGVHRDKVTSEVKDSIVDTALTGIDKIR